MTNEPSRVADTQGKIEDGYWWLKLRPGAEQELVRVNDGFIYARCGVLTQDTIETCFKQAQFIRRVPSPDEMKQRDDAIQSVIDGLELLLSDSRSVGISDLGAMREMLKTSLDLTTPQGEGKSK